MLESDPVLPRGSYRHLAAPWGRTMQAQRFACSVDISCMYICVLGQHCETGSNRESRLTGLELDVQDQGTWRVGLS